MRGSFSQTPSLIYLTIPNSTFLNFFSFTRPWCCMDAGGLFMGDATLRKIFCLQETLRGVRGRPPLTESLLQPDRVLFLPSPLLREKTAVSQTPDKGVRYHLTASLFQQPLRLLTHTHTHTHTHVYPILHKGTYILTFHSETTQETFYRRCINKLKS